MSVRTIQVALDQGISALDTAEGYGDGASESIVGEAIGSRRHQVVIATKVSAEHLQPKELRAACERSLQNLNTDYIDVYQIHYPNDDVPMTETLETLERLRDEGKIRAIGVSNFGKQDLGLLAATGTAVTTDQLPYSLLWRAIEAEIVPALHKAGMGVLCYSPFAQGLLTGKFRTADEVPEGRARTRLFSAERPQSRHHDPDRERLSFATIDALVRISEGAGIPLTQLSLAWLLAQPIVTAVIAGARSVEQVEETARAAQIVVPPEVLRELSGATETLRESLGTNADPWTTEGRIK